MTVPTAEVVSVIANTDADFKRVMTLGLSLRNFGGAGAGCAMHVYFVGEADIIYSGPLATIGVTSSVVAAPTATTPQSARLRALAGAQPSAAVVVALDCDVVAFGDFSAILSPDTVRAAPATTSPLSGDEWSALLSRFNLPSHEARWTMSASGQVLDVPFVDPGVLVIPGQRFSRLATAWASYGARLDPRGGDTPLPDAAVPVFDRVALTLALLESRIPVEPLRSSGNAGGSARSAQPPERLGLVRVGDRVEPSGRLKTDVQGVAGADIEKVNRLLHARGLVTPDPPTSRAAAVARAAAIGTKRVAEATRKRVG